MKNKKGQMGMDVAKKFLLGLLTLLIIGVVSLIILVSLSEMDAGTTTYTVTNETGAYINGTGYTLADAGLLGFTSPVITNAVNTTSNITILSGNYSVSNAGVLSNLTTEIHDPVIISYTYDASNDVVTVANNGTDALATFFTNTSTWLGLLGIAILILIISVVIAVVNRFGKGGTF